MCAHHPAKLTFNLAGLGRDLQINAVSLLDDFTVLKNVHEIVLRDLRKVVCDHNRGAVMSPALDGLENEYAGCCVQRRRRFV